MWGFELKGKGLCGCLCMCMSIAFLIRWPHTMAELKAASPFKWNNMQGQQCSLATSSCFVKGPIRNHF